MDTEQLRLVVAAAELAPSIHNTQPWQFVARPDGSLDVRVDPDRRLPAVDPSGRQLLVSCGAAVEFARLALRAVGRDCAVAVLPDAEDRDLVARLTPGDVMAPSELDVALVDAMGRRSTDRGPYDDVALPGTLVDTLRAGVEPFGVWLRQIDLPTDRVVVTAALADGEKRQTANPAYVDELRRWTHRAGRADGFAEPSPEWPVDVVSDMPMRDYAGLDGHRHTGPGDPPRVVRDALVLLGSVGDDAESHVAAGRALGWLWLRLTVEGVSAQPLGQAMDDRQGRARLAADLRLIGHPQFLLRLGYGHASAQTARRSLRDAFTVTT
jgi:hypothetical protein